jgi:hypothetical protein
MRARVLAFSIAALAALGAASPALASDSGADILKAFFDGTATSDDQLSDDRGGAVSFLAAVPKGSTARIQVGDVVTGQHQDGAPSTAVANFSDAGTTAWGTASIGAGGGVSFGVTAGFSTTSTMTHSLGASFGF